LIFFGLVCFLGLLNSPFSARLPAGLLPDARPLFSWWDEQAEAWLSQSPTNEETIHYEPIVEKLPPPYRHRLPASCRLVTPDSS